MPKNKAIIAATVKPEGFTVVGVYDGKTEDRYAEHFDTKTAREAEDTALRIANRAAVDLVVAGVFAGKLTAIL